MVTSLVKHSGIEEISGFGISSIAREKGFYHTTSILHHYPGNDAGYLWSVFGKKAHALTGLDLLPENTAVAMFSDLDLPLVWSAVEKEAGASGIPEVTSWIQNVPNLFASATGLKLEDVLGSLGGEYGVVLTMDDSHMIALPLPGQGMQIPEPAVLLAVKVKNDVIFDYVNEKLKGMQVVQRDTNGIRMRTVLVSLPLPISVRPTIARSGDYLLVASTDSIIEAAMAVQNGKKPGLKSTAEFKRLAQGTPQKGNQFSFISQKFTRAIQDIQVQSLRAGGSGNNAPQSALMEKLLSLSGPPAAAYGVSANGDDGIVSSSNGNQDASKAVLLVPVAVSGALAAVALPNFARGPHHRATRCVHQ